MGFLDCASKRRDRGRRLGANPLLCSLARRWRSETALAARGESPRTHRWSSSADRDRHATSNQDVELPRPTRSSRLIVMSSDVMLDGRPAVSERSAQSAADVDSLVMFERHAVPAVAFADGSQGREILAETMGRTAQDYQDLACRTIRSP